MTEKEKIQQTEEEQMPVAEIFKKPIVGREVCTYCGSPSIYKYGGKGEIMCKKCANRGHDPIKAEPKVGRNAACPCGSGKKYKKCCLK